MRKKQNPIRSEVSERLKTIRAECKKNEEGDQIQTSYKPLLFQSVDTSPKKQQKKITSLHNKTTTFTFFVSEKALETNVKRPSKITKFLQNLYKEKVKDLKSFGSKKQEEIFIKKMSKGISEEQFKAMQCDLGVNCSKIIPEFLITYQIKTLVLDKNPIGDEGIKILSKFFCDVPIKQISLVSINMSSKGGKQLFKNITGLSTLKSINFSSLESFNRNRLKPEGIEGIKEVLQHENCHLQEISLANVNMGTQGFLHFCQGLNKNSSLEVLNLALNDIRFEKEKIEFCLDKFGFTHIKKLNMSQNKLGDEGMPFFAELLCHRYGRNEISSYIRELDLSDNGINSDNSELFCLQSAKNKTLSHIKLNNNPLSNGKSFHHFRHMLNHNWSIKHLEMRNSIQTSQDLQLISEGVEKNHSLVYLDISGSFFDEGTFLYFVSHISGNKSLKTLKLNHCRLTDDAIVTAFLQMRANKKITTMEMNNNYIHDKGGRALLRLLMENQKICQMGVKKNCLSLSVISEIQRMLKENKIISQLQQPDLRYQANIEKLQEEQKKHLKDYIKDLQERIQKKKTKALAEQIVEKKIKLEELQKTYEKEKAKLEEAEKKMQKENSFLVTAS